MTSDVARMIRLARDQARLTTLDYATQLFDDFIDSLCLSLNSFFRGTKNLNLGESSIG